MFKLAAVKKVWWPVEVKIPQDGGAVLEAQFDAELEILDDDVHNGLLAKDLPDRVLVGWKRVKDESGTNDEPFTPENRAKMLQIPYVRMALLKAYYEASQGQGAERKNSPRPRAGTSHA